MSYTSLLKDTCTVRRYTEGAVDDYGIPAKTWADHLTEDCRLEAAPASGGREIKIGAEVVVADYRLFIGDVDVTEQDRVVIGTDTYEVLLVEAFSDFSSSHHKRCWLRLVR